MRKIINIGSNAYEIDDHANTITNIQTGAKVTRIWAYPVKQAVWGGVPNTLYFATSDDRDNYMADHDYCDKLPRCKVMTDMIDQ